MFESFAAEFGSMLAGNYYRFFSRRQSIGWYYTSHVIMDNGDKMARYPSYHLNNRNVYTI
ncbi:hypothetical protein ABES23_13480 [Peribacillus frigoritolerans]|uniref:hypothetical protein n=1 Tax=Peribacillus frigoritolerans TaxID=450367 RepID=UPI003D287108